MFPLCISRLSLAHACSQLHALPPIELCAASFIPFELRCQCPTQVHRAMIHSTHHLHRHWGDGQQPSLCGLFPSGDCILRTGHLLQAQDVNDGLSSRIWRCGQQSCPEDVNACTHSLLCLLNTRCRSIRESTFAWVLACERQPQSRTLGTADAYESIQTTTDRSLRNTIPMLPGWCHYMHHAYPPREAERASWRICNPPEFCQGSIRTSQYLPKCFLRQLPQTSWQHHPVDRQVTASMISFPGPLYRSGLPWLALQE